MKSRILSLNIGGPAPMEWNGKSIVSSMLKHPVPGPLVVHETAIEGDSFANPKNHGTPDSIIYAFGMSSALEFAKRLGMNDYVPGSTGETVTLDHLDEFEVSVGDVFRFGEVLAQATFPRIPCGKVNFRMQHEHGQKAMQECGRSGVYFRILKPGVIRITDEVSLFEKAQHQLLISDVYRIIVQVEKPSQDIVARAQANGAMPKRFLDKWTALAT